MSNMGIQYVKKSDQESECLSAAKPPAYEIELGFPLVSLTDRQFEFLLHDVFNADLAEKKVEDRFDTVLLMLGVAERGRDCALLKAGKHVGVIQCKRYESLLTKPDVVREILKFILHAIKDPRLLPDPTNFLYVFATSRDFNGATKELLANFNESVLKEPKLKEWTVEVIEGYETLKDLVYDKIRDELISILGKIKVTPLNGNDINTKLVGRSTIIQKYFTVKKVIAEENLDELKKMVELVAGKISDVDVARLLDKLQHVPADRRLDVGILSLWGYPRQFVEGLFAQKALVPIGNEISLAKTKLDMAFLNFLQDKVRELVFQRITLRGDISPFTIQAVVPYVFGRLSFQFQEKTMGKTIVQKVMHLQEPDLGKLKEQFLKTGEAVLKNDFSGFAAKGPTVELVKDISRFTHKEFRNADEMSDRFDKDWVKITGIVSDIESELSVLIPDGTIVVARSLEWFDDENYLGKVLEQMNAFFANKSKAK